MCTVDKSPGGTIIMGLNATEEVGDSSVEFSIGITLLEVHADNTFTISCKIKPVTGIN